MIEIFIYAIGFGFLIGLLKNFLEITHLDEVICLIVGIAITLGIILPCVWYVLPDFWRIIGPFIKLGILIAVIVWGVKKLWRLIMG